jgi:arylsulfate sulfotransferase
VVDLIVTKKIGFAIIGLLLIAGTAAAVLFSGILVMPTSASLANDTLVRNYDIIDYQHLREQDILTDYGKGHFTLQQPYIIQDPYQANPLSALILFETNAPAQVTLTVTGKDPYTSFSITQAAFTTHHEVAVLGLYPGRENQVTLSAAYSNGQKEAAQQAVRTEPLPADFPTLTVSVSKPAQMEPGVDLMISCLDHNYTYLLDARGEVRGYFSNKNFGHCTAMRVLKNGRLLATGDVLKMMPYNMYTLWEMNLLGKVFVEYDIPNGVHHDIIELANGDFLAASNNPAMPLGYDTREDVVIRIDRQTGAVKQAYNLRQILDDSRETYNHFNPGVQNATNRDWAHLNSVDMDASDNSIIISSATQNAVVKFNAATQKIAWILSSPQGWDGAYSKFKPYLLKPVGSNFEWQWGQHSAKLLPDSDHDPNTVDILLFDDGQSRSTTQADSLSPANNYSRAVIYRVNQKDMTVQQLWQYGKERGSEAYATFLGNADLLKQTGNINIDFGGMLRANGVPVDDIIQGVIGKEQIESRVVEVQRDGQVVFELLATPNQTSDAASYQVRKIDLYTGADQISLAQSEGTLKGTVQTAEPTAYSLPSFFIPTISLSFNQLYVNHNNLVLQGSFQYEGKTYLLGKIIFVLKNSQHEYIYSSNPGINGTFEARIGLSSLPPGEYAIYAAGGVVDGTDAAGKAMPGYVATGYKVQVK